MAEPVNGLTSTGQIAHDLNKLKARMDAQDTINYGPMVSTTTDQTHVQFTIPNTFNTRYDAHERIVLEIHVGIVSAHNKDPHNMHEQDYAHDVLVSKPTLHQRAQAILLPSIERHSAFDCLQAADG